MITAKFSEEELFLIEMALDEVLYKLQNVDSPMYHKFDLVNHKIYSLRQSEKGHSDT